MKALVFRGPGTVAYEDVPDPEILEPTDAIVRVTTTSICGSDLHLYRGRVPGLMEGTVIGHEVLGVVEAVGPAVTRARPGDRVAGSFMIPCGRCWWCRRGEYNVCDNGGFHALGYGIFTGDLQGAQAEMVRMPMADLTLLPIGDDLSDEQAVFTGDALATGCYVASVANIAEGDTVAVLGCGPVGLFSLLYAKLARPGRIAALDSVPERLRAAERLGAEPIDISRQNPVVAVGDLTDQRGADVVLECVGHEAAFLQAFNMLRAGGHLVVAGVYVELEYPFPLGEAWRKNVRITFTGITPVMRYWEQALDSVRNGLIDPTAIITHTFPLSEGVRAYELFDTKQATKVLLTP